ncbi:MAG: hypothetical protein V3V33_08515 [Candidatus Lokiarchaeia archaeon]
MGKCPYCSKELHIEDFYESITKETKKGEVKTRLGPFIGETTPGGFAYMWVCPSCDTILGFTGH